MKSQLILYENEADKIFYRFILESPKSKLIQQIGANFKLQMQSHMHGLAKTDRLHR